MAGDVHRALLRLVESLFDVFLTADQNIRYQQNLSGYQVAVVELSTNNFRKLRKAVPLIDQAIQLSIRGQVTRLEIP